MENLENLENLENSSRPVDLGGGGRACQRTGTQEAAHSLSFEQNGFYLRNSCKLLILREI